MRAGSGVCERGSDNEEDYHGEYESSTCQHNTTASDAGSTERRNRALTRGTTSPDLRRPPSCPGSRWENRPWRGAMDSIRGPGHIERGQQGACLTPAATAAMLTHSQPSWLGTDGTLQCSESSLAASSSAFFFSRAAPSQAQLRRPHTELPAQARLHERGTAAHRRACWARAAPFLLRRGPRTVRVGLLVTAPGER